MISKERIISSCRHKQRELWKKSGAVYVSEFWKLILALFSIQIGNGMTEVAATILHIFGYVLLIWFVVSIINGWNRRKTVE